MPDEKNPNEAPQGHDDLDLDLDLEQLESDEPLGTADEDPFASDPLGEIEGEDFQPISDDELFPFEEETGGEEIAQEEGVEETVSEEDVEQDVEMGDAKDASLDLLAPEKPVKSGFWKSMPPARKKAIIIALVVSIGSYFLFSRLGGKAPHGQEKSAFQIPKGEETAPVASSTSSAAVPPVASSVPSIETSRSPMELNVKQLIPALPSAAPAEKLVVQPLPPPSPPPEPIATKSSVKEMLMGMKQELDTEMFPLRAGVDAATAHLAQMEHQFGALTESQIQLSEMVKAQTKAINPSVTQKLGEQVEALRTALVQMQETSKMLTTNFERLQDQIKSVQHDIAEQSTIVAEAQQESNLARQALLKQSEQRLPKLVVQAIVPGRAWLKSEAGEILTVVRGDEVQGYGHVMDINPTSGSVTMSSQVVFREDRGLVK